MKNTVKRQHYVPKTYLQRFCDDSGLLCAYDMEEKSIKRDLPRSFAPKKFFYDLPADEMLSLLHECYSELDESTVKRLTDTQCIEKMLGNIEGHTATILRELDSGQLLVTDERAQTILTLFLQTLSVRTLAQRKTHEYIQSITENWLGQLNIPLSEGFKECCGKKTKNHAKEEQIRELIDRESTFRFSCMLLGDYEWFIGIVESKIKLITSDNPAQLIAFGINDFCFPISPQRAIIMRRKDSTSPVFSPDIPDSTGIVKLSWKSVLIYNMLQIQQANRFLFGDKHSVEMMKLLLEKYIRLIGGTVPPIQDPGGMIE